MVEPVEVKTSPIGRPPRPLMLIAVAAVGVALVAAALLSGGGSNPDVVDISAPVGTGDLTPAIGNKVAPPFTAERLNGSGSVSLSDYRGQPVLINFFASWCPPCVDEMPELEEAHLAHPGVAFVGIANNDPPDAVQKLIDQTGTTYDVLLDPFGEIYASFGGFAMPTTIFLDGEGRIVTLRGGRLDPAALETQLLELVGVSS